jgi:hypothetical protein
MPQITTLTLDDDELIAQLRVAQGELISGDTSGRVFCRLSPGAAAIQMDRTKLQDQVAADLRRALLDQSSMPTTKNKK